MLVFGFSLTTFLFSGLSTPPDRALTLDDARLNEKLGTSSRCFLERRDYPYLQDEREIGPQISPGVYISGYGSDRARIPTFLHTRSQRAWERREWLRLIVAHK